MNYMYAEVPAGTSKVQTQRRNFSNKMASQMTFVSTKPFLLVERRASWSTSISVSTWRPPIHSLKKCPQPLLIKAPYMCTPLESYPSENNDRSDHTSPMNGSSPISSSSYSESSSYTPPKGTEPESEAEQESQVVDTDAREVPLSELKSELFATLASVNRGFSVTPTLRSIISALLSHLERISSSSSSQASPLSISQRTVFSGNWRLIYTNAPDVLSLGLLAPIALVNQVYQTIEYTEKDSDIEVNNIIELEPPIAPLFSGNMRTFSKIIVKASGDVRSETALGLVFDSVRVEPQTVFGVDVPEGIKGLIPSVRIGSPVGQFETTFLDEDLRISRANFGKQSSVFVFIREP